MRSVNAAVRIVAVSILMAHAGYAAAQQAYPAKPIRMLVPYPPGGSNNALARIVGQKLSESWGQQVVVDNRPGGNTIIGSEALVKSPPDGYTLMLTSIGAHAINRVLLPALPYDSIKDFAPVATVSYSELMLVVPPALPANTLQEFIALAKAKPGQLNYATSGAGSTTHLTAEFFNLLAGVKTQHIPYKGAAGALTDLLGGQVQMYYSVPINIVSHVKSGKLKGIAVTGETRVAALPQVPTFTEAGLPGLDMKSSYGIFAPAAIPKEIVGKLSAEVSKILSVTETREALRAQGMEPFVSTPEQFAALIKADIAKFGKIAAAANIKMEH